MQADLRASIMRNQVWDSPFAHLHSLDLAEFVFRLSLFNAMDCETTFGIVDQTEVLAGLVNGDDIHITRRVGDISSDLAINLDETLHQDSSGFTIVERVLQTVSEKNNQGEAVALFLSSC